MRLSYTSYGESVRYSIRIFEADLMTLKLSRICQVCGEEIIDHRYFCILDPKTDKYHFYHSKGKCKERLLSVSLIREKWLDLYQNVQETVD